MPKFTNHKTKKPSCTVYLSNIMYLLHNYACKATAKQYPDFNFVNSAIQKNGNKVVFSGAGQQVIVITPTTDEYDSKKLIAAIKEYALNFTGQEIQIHLNLLHPIYSTDSSIKAPTLVPESNDVEKQIYDMLFEKKLFHKKPLYKYRDDKDDSTDNILGYYVRFDTVTGKHFLKKNAQEKTMWNSIKSTMTEMINNTYFASFNWKSGSTGEKKYLGDMLNSLMGYVDKDKLVSSFQEQLAAIYPGMYVDVKVLNSKSVYNYLKSRLTDDEIKKLNINKLNTNIYSLCVKVSRHEKNYELITKPFIAEIIDKSIEKNLVNKMTTDPITEKDVILINFYNDNMKERNRYIFSNYTDKQSVDIKNVVDVNNNDYKKLADQLIRDIKFIYEYNRISLISRLVKSSAVDPSKLNVPKFSTIPTGIIDRTLSESKITSAILNIPITSDDRKTFNANFINYVNLVEKWMNENVSQFNLFDVVKYVNASLSSTDVKVKTAMQNSISNVFKPTGMSSEDFWKNVVLPSLLSTKGKFGISKDMKDFKAYIEGKAGIQSRVDHNVNKAIDLRRNDSNLSDYYITPLKQIKINKPKAKTKLKADHQEDRG